jgi:hypothetical protein
VALLPAVRSNAVAGWRPVARVQAIGCQVTEARACAVGEVAWISSGVGPQACVCGPR